MPNGTVYYLGNKSRSADAVVEICLREFGKVNSAFDLFAGSGTIARALATHMRVITNDIQAYSWKLCSAALQGDQSASESLMKTARTGLLKEASSALLSHFASEVAHEKVILENSLDNKYDAEARRQELSHRLRQKFGRDFPIVGNYGSVYFSIKNACELQAAANFSTTLPPEEKLLLDAGTISAASHSSLTVGNQFAQPIKLRDKNGLPKKESIKKYAKGFAMDSIDFVVNSLLFYPCKGMISNDNICLNSDDKSAMQTHAANAAFIYLDPPYGREHYSRYYHVLESIATNDYSEISDNLSRMRGNRFQSPYGHRTKARRTFEQLIANARSLSLPVALSYVDETRGKSVANRILSLDDLREILRSNYSYVKEYGVSGKTYSQFNQLGSKRDSRIGHEVLFIAK
ncbi:MAG: DNA adenine methylase [Neoaquamicrobium sediminum]